MIHETIDIWDGCGCGIQTGATLTAYIPDNSPEIDMTRRNQTVLICPGGGYGFTSDREAEPLALAFLGEGFSAFVLRYSVAPERFPTQLLEVSRAMQLIRGNAEAWHVDIGHIAVLGFSAGGHLAGSLGVFWNAPFVREALSIGGGENRPDRMVLCYPVITSTIGPSHRESFYNLMGEGKSEEEYTAASLERHVGVDTPPAFLWHTANDGLVPAENSLIFASALQAQHIPFELHIYPDGPHGLSLADRRTAAPGADALLNPRAAEWFGACVRWLRNC